MAHIPSRMSTPELNLDHAPLAGRASSASSSPNSRSLANQSSPRQRSPRCRTGISFGRVVLFVAVLAALGAGGWWFACGRSGGEAAGGEEPREARQPASGLSDVSDEMRPVVEYLYPSDAEVKLWLSSVLASSYVQEKWGPLADHVALAYGPKVDAVNAFAFYNKDNSGRPSIALCGGWVRLARLMGALTLVQSSAVAQGVEKDIKAYLRRISGVVAETGELSEETVINLLNEFGVSTSEFQDVGAVSAAKGFADGVCKATLAHEFGHLAGGHPRGADLNKTVSQNEERQADLFASSVAASVANGQQMLRGQILTWYTLALVETINPTNEVFRSHPYSADRLRSAIDANKSLAASLGITAEDVDNLVAELSGGDAGNQETADSGGESSEDIDYDANTSGAVEKSLIAAAAVLDAAKTNDTGTLTVETPPDVEKMLPAEPQGKNIRSIGGTYTEIGAVTRMSMLPSSNFQLRLDLVRVDFVNGGLVLTSGRNGSVPYAAEGSVGIGGQRYAVFARPTGGERLFIAENGEMLGVVNAVAVSLIVFYDKGDTRRFRASMGLGRGVAFPNVDRVANWSLSQPVRIDPSALASMNFGGASRNYDCPICHGTGYCKRLGGATYGQSRGDNWVSEPCPNPSCLFRR